MPSKRHLSSAGQKRSNGTSAHASLGRKRKAEAVVIDKPAEPSTRSQKRQKGKASEHPPVQNNVPTQLLDVYVFGTNCYGELGLGDLTKKSEILRPVLNEKLAANSVGIVHVAVGGVHSAALTHDNRILTWGVNDEGTLARDTKQDKKEADTNGANNVNGEAESDDESDDDEITLNLKEATPLPVDPSLFPKGTVFAQLAASDSATFALTVDGLVYGWGTFRVCLSTAHVHLSLANDSRELMGVLDFPRKMRKSSETLS